MSILKFKKEESGTNGLPAKFARNHFAEGTIINGDIKSEGDIRLEGKIMGSVTCNAKIALGKTGIIDGEIQCINADIEGKIFGKVNVKEILILKATAQIEGDIFTNKLVVEEGAKFNGACTMGVTQALHGEKTKTTTLKKEVV